MRYSMILFCTILSVGISYTGCGPFTKRPYGVPTYPEAVRKAPLSDAIGETDAPAPTTILRELPDYLRYGATHNPNLKAAYARWLAASERIPVAGALPDPQVTYGFFIQEVETRVGPMKDRLEAMQSFPFYNKRSLRTEIATRESDIFRSQFNRHLLQLFRDIKTTYYELFENLKTEEITSNMVGLLEYFEAVLRSRYKAAIGSHPDVIKAQVELAKLQDQLQTIAAQKQPIMAKLNALLNRPSDAPLDITPSITLVPVNRSRETLLEILLKHNPTIQEKKYLLAKEKAGVRLAQKDYFPDVAIGVSYTQTDNIEMGVNNVNNNGKDSVMGMIKVNVPIWYKRLGGNVRAHKALRVSAEHQIAQTRNALTATLDHILFAIEDSRRKINLFKDSLVPKAEESMKATETAFQAGRTDFLNLLDAQRQLLAFQLELVKSRVAYAKAVADLERLIGHTI